MTTLVATQQPLQLLSMSDKPVRRSKRQPAAAADYEQDDDFHFVRKSKKAKTEETQPEEVVVAAAVAPSPPPAQPVRKTRKSTRKKDDKVDKVVEVTEEEAPPRTKRKTRKKPSSDASNTDEEPPAKIAKGTTTTTTRSKRVTRSKAQVASESADVDELGDKPADEPENEPADDLAESTSAPAPAPTTRSRTNGTARTNGRGRKKAAPAAAAAAAAPPPPPPPPPPPRRSPSPPPMQVPVIPDSPVHEASVESAKIALPMSDTPIINRNKEMRKKGGTSNRRSSLGSRGRRASSLIESGQTAIPHREVDPSEFYKHIAAEGLPEPRRMKQLLMWCGERALAAKPQHGNPNSSAILGARAIQDQLLKDFASKSECSDWFSREDDVPQAPIILQPNPRNLELDEKKAALEARIKRLQEEKKSWLAIRKPPPEEPPLFTPEDAEKIILPEFDLLDLDDGKIRGYLADEANSSSALRSKTEARLRRIRSSLEFEVDQLVDNVHKLEQRVKVAGREADKVLALSSMRLKEREDRERRSAGTKDMPIMEVLRSLSSILPEGGG